MDASNTPPPPPQEDASEGTPPEPTGKLRFLWFDGILEGPRPEGQYTAAKTVQAMNSEGFGQGEFVIDGGRCSLLFDSAARAGEGVSDRQREGMASRLQELISQFPEDGPIESTLRCTEVFSDVTRETLFAPVGRELKVVGRLRPITPEDLQKDPSIQLVTAPSALSRRSVLLLSVVFVALAGLLAWKGGYIDRIFGSSSNELEFDANSFEGLLKVDVESAWGSYNIKVTRGDTYPLTPDSLEGLKKAADTTEKLAAINAVANGGEVWLQLLTEDDKVLSSKQFSTGDLVSDDEGEVKFKLQAAIGAAVVRLSLSSGESKK